MTTILRIAIVGAAFLLGAAGFADAPLIFCVGTEAGGDGPSQYAYRIDSGSYPMMQFMVGTNDLDRSNYTNLLIPKGWQFALEEPGNAHSCGVKTPTGRVSLGRCRSLTTANARWWTDDPAYAVEFFTFGFDHPWSSEDVGWDLHTEREGGETYDFEEFWDAQVGTGMGPVHGPYDRMSKLSLWDPLPGQAGEINALDSSGAMPIERVYFACGLSMGQTQVPGCPELFVNIAGARLAGVAVSDECGFATLFRRVPKQAAGRPVYFQAVETATCRVSNLIDWTFE